MDSILKRDLRTSKHDFGCYLEHYVARWNRDTCVSSQGHNMCSYIKPTARITISKGLICFTGSNGERLLFSAENFFVLYFKTAHFPDCDRTDTKRNVWHRCIKNVGLKFKHSLENYQFVMKKHFTNACMLAINRDRALWTVTSVPRVRRTARKISN